MSDPLAVLHQTKNGAGRLLKAVAFDFQDCANLRPYIVLEFEHARMTISAVADDDTIALSTELPTDTAGCAEREAIEWCAAYGKSILWGWTLTNHQGYLDGVRIEFRETVEQPAAILEVIVVASGLRTTVVPSSS